MPSKKEEAGGNIAHAENGGMPRVVSLSRHERLRCFAHLLRALAAARPLLPPFSEVRILGADSSGGMLF